MTELSVNSPSARGAHEEWTCRLTEMREQPEYQAYEHVRRQVLAQLELGRNRRTTGHVPSDYWSGELAKFEYMLDASPLIIEKLRQHTHNITGIHTGHYRESMTKRKRRFTEKLAALRALDDAELWIPEARALGTARSAAGRFD